MKRLVRRPYQWAVLFSLLLTLVTTFVLLDAFVLPHEGVIAKDPVIIKKEPEAENPDEIETPEITEPIITENSYRDNDIEINITKYYEYDTNIFVADIKISSINYLKTAFANNTYGKNITTKTSKMAAKSNAILAINGDYYGFRSTGYVVRNGNLYRENVRSGHGEDLVIYNDGNFGIINEKEITAKEVFEKGVLQIFCFGPSLVNNGEITYFEPPKSGMGAISNPRSAIGMIEPLHYVFVSTDGRLNNNRGLNFSEFGLFLKKIGCKVAYNLDGGGSATLWFNGALVNKPCDGRYIGERNVSDIVYIGY